MNLLPLSSMISSGVFFSAGGKNFLFARREMMPVILLTDCFYVTHDPWAFTMLAACVFTALGYGVNSKFRHIFGDAWGRGVWGLLVALSLSLWAVLTGHLAWYWFAAYLTIGFFFEPLFKNLYQVVGDFLIGCGFGVIVFFMKSGV